MSYCCTTVLILKRFAPKGRFALLRQFCEFFAEAWRPRNPPPHCDSFNSQNSAFRQAPSPQAREGALKDAIAASLIRDYSS
jgi:hypothetical protein